MEALSQFLPSLEAFGSAGVVGVISLVLSYVFIIIFSNYAFTRYGLTEIKLPLGIFLKKEHSTIEADSDSDAVIIESLYETMQQLEYRAREKMRRLMQETANTEARKHPEYREYILRGRVAVSTAISDNHIVYSLTDDRITDYIALKQDQACEAVCEQMPPDAERYIKHITALYFTRVIKIQKWLCMEKISAYEAAITRMRISGSKVRCETKIQKNRKYLEAIASIEGSAIVRSFEEQSIVLDNIGSKMVVDNIAHIETVIEPEVRAGIISVGSKSDVILNPTKSGKEDKDKDDKGKDSKSNDSKIESKIKKSKAK